MSNNTAAAARTAAAKALPTSTTTELPAATPKTRTRRQPKAAVRPIRKAVGPQPELIQSKAATAPLKEDYTYLADKEPTDLHTAMAKWMSEVTGVEVTAKQAQIVAVLRHEFQRSEVNQADLATRRAAAAAKAEAAAKARKAHLQAEAKRIAAELAKSTKAAAKA